MKLIKQVKLYFQEGTSDKVYEIDLCESGEGFLVNFRYGRRGASLKEGTKTIFPVSLPDAEKTFNSLEEEKRKKGYVSAGEVQSTIPTDEKSKPGNDKRKKAILKLLKTAAAGEVPEHWALSRIMWRAGDLKIPEAIPYIIQLADPSDPANIYSAVWATGRCGTTRSLGFLQNLQKDKNLPLHVQQLVFEALLKLSDGKDKEGLLSQALLSLPSSFQKTIADKNYKQFARDLRNYLFELKTSANDYLIGIYQLSREDRVLHEIFLKILKEIPLAVNYFKYIRNIFKTSGMVQDYETYGIIARQIEKQPFAYKASSWMNAEQKKNLAFSDKTKAYLTGSTIRQLRKYGEAGEDSYVDLATGILLAFSDEEDKLQAHSTSDVKYSYSTETRTYTKEETRTDFDTYSKYQAYNNILYKNSPRYCASRQGWSCVHPYKPGDPAPSAREEGYPHLWNQASEEIIQLLSFARTLSVHEFALKVWQANPGFEALTEISSVILFLQSSFPGTQLLGLDLARKKYNKNSPDKLLLIAMLDSSSDEVRKQAEQWVMEQRTTLQSNTEFMADLVLMRKTDSHAWLRGFLATASFTKEQAEIIIARVISSLLNVEWETEEDQRYINQVSDTLIIAFTEHLRSISLDIVGDLFRHASPAIHTLAGKILMKHNRRPEDLPEDFLQMLLRSDNAQSRSIGIALLGKFPEEILLKRKEILVSFCLSPLADVRDAVKPIIMKLVKAYPQFGNELVDLFVPAFLMKESYEGLHDDLINLLSNELNTSLHVIPKEKTLRLLNSKYRSAQLIGSVLLKRNVKPEDLTVPEVVKLGSNPLEEIRKMSWDIFKSSPDKIKSDKDEALKITDSSWDDTRIFAFDFFRNTFSASEWTPELLIVLCDSTKDDVQDFGREMITKFFDANHGLTYLLKLSQHPGNKVQLFTTAYLEKYAADKPEILGSLELYFITLLSQVNKGKVSKTRIMDFLRRESLKNDVTAVLCARIFTRVSISVAIAEKAECIIALRDIRNRFPAIEIPIKLKEYSDYIKA